MSLLVFQMDNGFCQLLEINIFVIEKIFVFLVDKVYEKNIQVQRFGLWGDLLFVRIYYLFNYILFIFFYFSYFIFKIFLLQYSELII